MHLGMCKTLRWRLWDASQLAVAAEVDCMSIRALSREMDSSTIAEEFCETIE